MKIHIRDRPLDLVFIVVMTALLHLAIGLAPNSTVRTILGLPYILFFPGYVLISFLFPEEEPLDKIERIALSFGLSIAITPLVGLLLNYIWEISLTPIIVSLSIFIVIFSALAAYRRFTIPEDERFSIYLEVNPPDWENYDVIDKALVIATVGLLIASGGLAYHIATTPRTGERFTEFYVLGPEGKADDYPTNISVNESGHVILGAINREHREVDYQVGIRLAPADTNNLTEEEVDFNFQNMSTQAFPSNYNMTLHENTTYFMNFTLGHDEKLERDVNYTIQEPGLYKVQFVLVKSGQDITTQDPYRELHLWVTVRE